MPEPLLHLVPRDGKRLYQLAFKGNEGPGEEKTTLAEETVFLQGAPGFVGRGQNVHRSRVSEFG
jgi:hypothetical protein